MITESRCLVLCAENRSEMEAWATALRGALHRGADVADLVARLSSGDHHWLVKPRIQFGISIAGHVSLALGHGAVWQHHTNRVV